MPELTLKTGLRHRSGLGALAAKACRYHSDAIYDRTVFQDVHRIHRQPMKGSCVGEALTGRIESSLNVDLSGVGLWTDARRRQGDLLDADTGTDFDHAIASLIHRGVESYVPGEETRSVEEDTQLAELSQELQADDRKFSIDVERFSIPCSGTALSTIADALANRMAVVFGAGVRYAYETLGKDEIATPDMLNSPSNGHEQGIVAVIAGDDRGFPEEQRGTFLIQNSWDVTWGGYTLPVSVRCADGTRLPAGTVFPGCVLATRETIIGLWDIDAFQIVTVAG
jgi:hypothetical protein